MPDSNVPSWLVDRVRYGTQGASSVSQDIQAGANMYEQSQRLKMARERESINNELNRLKVEGERYITHGAIELGRLMEEGGRDNAYSTPEFEGKLWALGRKYPQLLSSPAFKGAVDVTEKARTAEDMLERAKVTQDGLWDRATLTAQTRLEAIDRQTASLEMRAIYSAEARERLAALNNEARMLRMQYGFDEKRAMAQEEREWKGDQADQKALAEMAKLRQSHEFKLDQMKQKNVYDEKMQATLNEYRKERDQFRWGSSPTSRFDLPQSKQKQMETELRVLEDWRTTHPMEKWDAVYDKKMEAIEKKYAPFRRKQETKKAAPAEAEPGTKFFNPKTGELQDTPVEYEPEPPA